MPRVLSRLILPCVVLFAVLASSASNVHALTIPFKSGTGIAGGPDANVRLLPLATTCPVGYPTVFTNADFAAAYSSPPATILSFIHPAWTPVLACDQTAQWIGVDAQATPLSSMITVPFFVPAPCCIGRATLSICYMVDDALGDAINPGGCYVNGILVPAVTGGNYAVQTIYTNVDITGAVHCGDNALYFYNRDLGCAVNGMIFSGKIEITSCFDAAKPSSWGQVRRTYR